MVIVGGTRTPFVKAGTLYAEPDVLDLANAATTEALARCEVSPRDVDEVSYGKRLAAGGSELAESRVTRHKAVVT